MIREINLKERTLEWMGRKQFRSSGRGTLWPSEASVKTTNQYGEEEVIGKCARSIYYRLNKVTPTNPPTAKSYIVFMLGHQIEAAITELWKQMGIWENNSVRWEDKEKNLSGEFDLILREEDFLYGAEIKSFYGYYANKEILGHYSGRGANKVWNLGHPKDAHLLQSAIYADQTRDRLKGFKLFYISRDNCDMAEFNIEVNGAGEIFINGELETRFKMEDVYARYAYMNNSANNSIKPPRDFVHKPDDARVEVLHERGEISDSAYKKHIEGKAQYTMWACDYCDFKDHCLNVDIEGETDGNTN